MKHLRVSAYSSSERGASLFEVLILIGLIGLVGFGAFKILGSNVNAKILGQAGTILDVPNCFAAETLVATPDGARAIEQIEVGDSVLARDEVTGNVHAARVLQTFVTPDMPIVDVRVSEDPNGVIRATPGHRFWTTDRGWIGASALATGEVLLDAAGDLLHVEGPSVLEVRTATVYNFEVEGAHTYFVGGARVWVHNPPLDTSNPATQPCSEIAAGAGGAPPPPAPPAPIPPGGVASSSGASTSTTTSGPASGAPTIDDGQGVASTTTPESTTATSPASAVLDDPATHAAKFPTTVDSNALAQAVAAAFDQRGYGPPHVIKNDLPSLEGQTAFISHRVYGSLPPGVSESIVQNGSIASEYRKAGVTTVADAQAQFAQYEHDHKVGDIASDVASHKGPGAGSDQGTKWVGVTADPNYLYNGFDGSKGSNGNRIGLYVYVKQQAGDKVVETASMQAYMKQNRWTKAQTKIFGIETTTDEHGGKVYTDNESEHLFGGAIPPSSIVYAAWAYPKNHTP